MAVNTSTKSYMSMYIFLSVSLSPGMSSNVYIVRRDWTLHRADTVQLALSGGREGGKKGEREGGRE